MSSLPTTYTDPIEIAILGGTGISTLPAPLFTPLALLPAPSTPWGSASSPIAVLSYTPPTGTKKTTTVAFLARHGVHHQYAPHEVPYRANVAALRKLGVRCVVGFSAVGSLKEEIAPRDFVVPDGLVDWTKGVRPFTFFEGGLVGHVSLADPFDKPLHDLIARTLLSDPSLLPPSSSSTTPPKIHPSGTLITIEGPTFSTRAESLLFRSPAFNCAVINMSACPEARLFREAEIAYALICMSTDYDSWHATNEGVSVEMVMGHMRANAENAKIVLGKVLEELAHESNQAVVSAQGWQGMSRGGAAGITKVEGRGKEAVERVKWLFDGEFE